MHRWGLIGPGRIAATFAEAMARVPDGEIVAVSSRSAERAEAFATAHGIARSHGSRDALLADPEVDVVYVATPHSAHEADTLAAIAAGRPVLCEKAFALDAAQGARMVAAARAAGTFLMEAMWSRFLPGYRELRRLLDDGAVGVPSVVEASFGFRAPYDPAHRLFDPALGGGALLDLGIYPVQLAAFVLGLPDSVTARATLGDTGVDETVAAVLAHPGGGTALVSASTRVGLACTARVSGTEGAIELPAFMHRPESLVLRRADGDRVIDVGFGGDGLRFEIEEVHRCLDAGATESPVMPLDESVALLGVLDEIRRQVGVTYPGL